MNKSGTNAPYFAQLDAYKAAMWGGFAFGVLGSLLAVLFLRGVGIVGHRPEENIDEEKTATSHSEDARDEQATKEMTEQ